MGQSDSLDDGHGHGSPWSSTSFQIATLFLIILAVVGIAIAIFHHGPHHARTSNPPATSHAGGPPATTTAPPRAAGLCSLPAGDQQVPSASYPQGTSWQPWARGSLSRRPLARSTWRRGSTSALPTTRAVLS